MAKRIIAEVKKNGIIEDEFFSMKLAGIKTNLHPPVKLNETSLKRIFNLHNENGFAIVYAFRSDWDITNRKKNSEINNIKTEELLNILKASKWPITPVYGGFIETIHPDGVEENVIKRQVYETSFIIYNYMKSKETGDINELFDFAVKLCDKFNQESIMFKGMGDSVPMWVNRYGDQTEGTFTGAYTLNDLTQEYFTSLIKTMNLLPTSSTKKTRTTFPKTTKRFTHEVIFESLYVNPPACTLNERRIRTGCREILLNDNW